MTRKNQADRSILVARGLVDGHRVGRVFGRNPDVGAITEAVRPSGGEFYWPSGLVTARIRAGGDPADTVDGAGARKIRVLALDADWKVVAHVLETNGALASAETPPISRMLRTQVVEVGTYGGSNVGTITLEDSSGTAHGMIEASQSITTCCRISVPADSDGYIQRIQWWVPASAVVLCTLQVRRRGDFQAGIFEPWITEFRGVVAGNTNVDLQEAPLLAPGCSDVQALAQVLLGQPREVACDFSGTLVRN